MWMVTTIHYLTRLKVEIFYYSLTKGFIDVV